MYVGRSILELARNAGARSLFVVGTGKNVGKTVALRAMYEAAVALGMQPGITSIGRDGEAVDAGDALPKPRLFLRQGTTVATARDVLPGSPATEIIELSRLRTAAGSLVYAGVRAPSYLELVGPPTASGIREVVNALLDRTEFVLVDGAVDRIAALAGGRDAIVVSCGAAAAPTAEEAVSDVRALVRRLRIPQHSGGGEIVKVDGAFTPSMASTYIAARERRPIVLRDPTQFALTGKSAMHALDRLSIRCERPLLVVAATVASMGRDRSFEPRLFAHDVADATGLPTFDIYAAECAA